MPDSVRIWTKLSLILPQSLTRKMQAPPSVFRINQMYGVMDGHIQTLGVQHYFLVTGFPGVFKPDRIFNALQFVLGCHPGINTASFASGVGVKSLTAAYGVNRADLSYIPGGVASGTAIIRPDLPELKENWSFLWQQTEYVMGGGETDFMFLVLATNQLLKK